MTDIISYSELAFKENLQVQKGMNYRPAAKQYSIFLMSAQSNAPYNDDFDEEKNRLFYEGENISKSEVSVPKQYDQPFFTKTGKLTNNAKFFKAAEDYKYSRRECPEIIQVYEKINRNIWSDKGAFVLIDAEYTYSDNEQRKTFTFILMPETERSSLSQEQQEDFEFSRRIPTHVKRTVWERCKGACIECGSTENLHFDHILPFSKGGSSTNPKNIQILCEKHNLEKSNKIQ